MTSTIKTKQQIERAITSTSTELAEQQNEQGLETALTSKMTETELTELKEEEKKQENKQKQEDKRVSAIKSTKSILTEEAQKTPVRKVYSEKELPLKVGLRLSVSEITHIDTTKQTYGIKGYLIYNWPATNEDVANYLETTKGKREKYKPQFKPQLHFVNDVKTLDYEEKHDVKIEYGRDGITPYNSQDLLFFNVIFTEEFNVKNFPFDVQDLRIVLTTTLHDPVDDIRLVPSHIHKNQFKLDKTWSSIVTHWEVMNNDVIKTVIGASSNKKKSYEVVLFRIQVKRLWQGIVYRFVAWLFLLGIMASATFAIDAVEDPSGRLGYAVTMASTVIAFQFFISTYIPEVAYLTLMDKYNWFTFAFVLAITIQTAVLAYGGNYYVWRDRIDNACFIALGATFVVGTIIFGFIARWAIEKENEKINKWDSYEQISRTFIQPEDDEKGDGEFDFDLLTVTEVKKK